MNGIRSGARRARQAAWGIAIIAFSALIGMSVAWRAPGLDLYARDRLMRARGRLAPAEEIVIVAIDEASIARFGRFPWRRGLMADALDRIGGAHPKAIALDILYSEPTTAGGEDDRRLAVAIARAGNVAVAAQLVAAGDGTRAVGWLRPLPEIESAAAGVGHVNVLTESDGGARGVSLRVADDAGQAYWALAVEAVRIGDRLDANGAKDQPQGVEIGTRRIPVEREAGLFLIKPRDPDSRTETVAASRMTIDYIGPTGSFAPRTIGFAELMEGRAPVESFAGKYVLIGATAATLGEQVATPFVHDEDDSGNQHGAMMPGVELLANSIQTILRERYYREMSDSFAALCALLAAAGTLALLTFAQGRFEAVKQLVALIGWIASILAIAWLAFAWLLIVPPVVSMLAAAVTAAPLELLRRSLVLNAELDARIAELASAGTSLEHSYSDGYSLNPRMIASRLRLSPAAAIVDLTESDAVAIFVRMNGTASEYRLAAAYGARVRSPLTLIKPHGSLPEAMANNEDAARFFYLDSVSHDRSQHHALVLPLGPGNDAAEPAGALVLAYSIEREPAPDATRLGMEMAASFVAVSTLEMAEGDEPRSEFSRRFRALFPRGIAWKARMLGALNRRALANSLIVDCALRSVDDGLIVASVDGRIVFINPRAAAAFDRPEHALIGSDLFQKLREAEFGEVENSDTARRTRKDLLQRIVLGRSTIEQEIAIRGGLQTRYFTLRITPVCLDGTRQGSVLGIVAALSDVSRQHELQRIKSDMMALVTHELRTPLTAIQGMSELLAQYEVDADRSRKLHLAINDEAKRLMRMIHDYLDLSRLESGAAAVRQAPIHLAPLIERTLLLLDPIAAQRGIRLIRRLAPGLPPLVADADLLARALTNLVDNAIKYSPEKTEVLIETRVDLEGMRIEVADHGPGIPLESQDRIFEKFYRAPHLINADVPGTGLGLALVREIAELHGGRITVASEPGVGSTFVLRLPLAEPPDSYQKLP